MHDDQVISPPRAAAARLFQAKSRENRVSTVRKRSNARLSIGSAIDQENFVWCIRAFDLTSMEFRSLDRREAFYSPQVVMEQLQGERRKPPKNKNGVSGDTP
jgi:hypothetical protein